METAWALEEAIELINAGKKSDEPYIRAQTRPATGYGASEAPRGMLYHRYELDDTGIIRDARIVPPTSQNLASIENDLTQLAPRLVAMTHPDATHLAEQAVRNYDPCISCATHFLNVRFEEE